MSLIWDRSDQWETSTIAENVLQVLAWVYGNHKQMFFFVWVWCCCYLMSWDLWRNLRNWVPPCAVTRQATGWLPARWLKSEVGSGCPVWAWAGSRQASWIWHCRIRWKWYKQIFLEQFASYSNHFYQTRPSCCQEHVSKSISSFRKLLLLSAFEGCLL